MSKKKIVGLFVVLIGIATLSVLIGGGIAQAQSTSKTIIIGTSADYPPFEWVDGNGNYVGFDMDVMRAIAIEEGYNIVIKDIGFDALIPALQSGKIDVIAADLTITAARAKVISYSAPYWAADFDVLVRKGSGLNIITALSLGHKVGAQTGTTQGEFMNNLIKSGINVQVKLYETNNLAILDLKAGRLDAFISDSPSARAFQKANSNVLVDVGVIHTGENAGFAAQKGDPKGILPLLKDGLAKLHANGVWDNLVAAYMTGELNKITSCYAQFGHYLTVEKDPVSYAKNLAACMTSK